MLRKILVVDDSFVNRAFLTNILSDEYEVITSENGQHALAMLYQHNDIDLILLDIVMPVMDGYEFLKELQKNKDFTLIPVIIQTVNDSIADEVKCLSMGASDFVTKPYKPEIVKNRIASIIRLRESAAMINLLQYDKLTGLYSKEFFYKHSEKLIKDNPSKEFDLICSNIENFKMINDRYGMEVGDDILKYIAKQFSAKQPKFSICGYWGTDKFAILTEHIKDYPIELLEKEIKHNFSNAPVPNLNIKFAIYRNVDKSLSISAMCDRAFIAIEEIKNNYECIVTEYDDRLRLKISKSQKLLEDLDSAIENGEFKLYFQPKHDTKTKQIVGAESLVRWNHSEYGFIPPSEFIPLFEKNKRMTKLDFFVWQETLRTIKIWKEEGKPIVPISINVSPADFILSDLPQLFIGLLKKYDIEPNLIDIEITETACTENIEQIVKIIEELKNFGFKIAMDDFGSGYSSLNMLNKFPIDTLKLDRGFIHNECSRKEKSILRFIIDLAKWLNMKTIAEGVETEEQYNILKNLGCDQIQGYYFSKPLPLDEFEEYYKNNI